MKDAKLILILFLSNLFNLIYLGFALVIPYQISYIKIFHPEYQVAHILNAVILTDVGFICSSFVFTPLVRAIGVANCFRSYSLLAVLTCFLMVNYNSMCIIMLAYFLVGLKHQLISLTIIYYLTYNLKKNWSDLLGTSSPVSRWEYFCSPCSRFLFSTRSTCPKRNDTLCRAD